MYKGKLFSVESRDLSATSTFGDLQNEIEIFCVWSFRHNDVCCDYRAFGTVHGIWASNA